MREIEFRGQYRATKEWAYGFYWHNQKDQHYIMYYEENDDGKFMVDVAILPETVGQFSGRNDVKGKEAYEGDICETIEHDVAFEIKWNQEQCAFMFYENQLDMWFDISALSNMQITSNIHDNPELLK